MVKAGALIWRNHLTLLETNCGEKKKKDIQKQRAQSGRFSRCRSWEKWFVPVKTQT